VKRYDHGIAIQVHSSDDETRLFERPTGEVVKWEDARIALIALDLIANTGMDARQCMETARGCLKKLDVNPTTDLSR